MTKKKKKLRRSHPQFFARQRNPLCASSIDEWSVRKSFASTSLQRNGALTIRIVTHDCESIIEMYRPIDVYIYIGIRTYTNICIHVANPLCRNTRPMLLDARALNKGISCRLRDLMRRALACATHKRITWMWKKKRTHARARAQKRKTRKKSMAPAVSTSAARSRISLDFRRILSALKNIASISNSNF